MNVLSQGNKELANSENPYNSSINNLSKGLLEIYSPPLNIVEKQIKELTSKQRALITQIHEENINLAEVQYAPEIQDVFNKMKVYHSKLLNIKKDMKLIYERSTKLKKRALRLQQTKEKIEQSNLSSETETTIASSSAGS